MSANKQPDGLGLWIFLDLDFIVLSFMGLFLPLPMVHLLLSGHAFLGVSAWHRMLRRRAACCWDSVCYDKNFGIEPGMIKITGANAGGAPRLQIRALRAARNAQF